MRMRLPLSRPSLNMGRSAGRGAPILSRDLLRLDVRGFSEAEGPVLLRDLDEVDPDILATHAQARQVLGDAAVERALLRQRAADRQRDLDDDDVVRARDAEVARVVDQVTGLVLAQELEAVLQRDVNCLHQRLVHGLAELLAPRGSLALQYGYANERHGYACAWRPVVRDRTVVRLKNRTSGAISTV